MRSRTRVLEKRVENWDGRNENAIETDKEVTRDGDLSRSCNLRPQWTAQEWTILKGEDRRAVRGLEDKGGGEGN